MKKKEEKESHLVAILGRVMPLGAGSGTQAVRLDLGELVPSGGGMKNTGEGEGGEGGERERGQNKTVSSLASFARAQFQ